MPKINAKTKRGDCERAAVWYAHKNLHCQITRRAVRTQWQKVDFFAADIVGKRSDGTHVYIQATAGQNQAVTARRRKLEVIPWHETDLILICQLVQTQDPASGRRKLWFFRVHQYIDRQWITHRQAVKIPREWFKAYRE